MARLLALLLVLVSASAAAAQPVERIQIPGGPLCEVERPSKHEVRLKCDNGAWDGAEFRGTETYELSKGRDWKALGLRPGWKSKKITRVFPPERDPLPVPDPAPLDLPLPAAGDAAPIIYDVNIVWSQQAQNALGGLAGAQARAALIIAITNGAYVNSGVPWVSARLVGTKLMGYLEAGGTSSGNPLSWMYGSANGQVGYGTEIRDFRLQTGADLTHMLTTDNACGQGYVSCVGTMCLSQAEVSCSTSNLSSTHEFGGHNIGMGHDPVTVCGVATCNPVGSYAYGHSWGASRSIMAYPGAGGNRVPWFSNPDVLHSGLPTGTATRNNARVLREQAARIAAQNNPPTGIIPGAGGPPQPKVN